MKTKLYTKLKSLMKKWREPLKWKKESDWYSNYCRAKRLVKKELLAFFQQNGSEIPVSVYAEVLGRGGAPSGALYKFARAEVLSRALTLSEVLEFPRLEMALTDVREIHIKYIREHSLSASEILRLLFKKKNSHLSAEYETMLASAIRDRYSREVYNEIQMWRKKRNKKHWDVFLKEGYR